MAGHVAALVDVSAPHRPRDGNRRMLDFLKERKREEKGWTQEYLAQLVNRTPRSIMYIENRGQYPSFDTFYQLVTLLEISVDQFFFPDKLNGESTCRKQIDVMLNSMNEKELTVMKHTAEGLQRARETEDA